MFVFGLDVQPIRDAQLANLAAMRELAGGKTDRAIIADITAVLLPTAFRLMPKDTGTAAAAQLAYAEEGGIGGIFTAPDARNPKSGATAESYLPFVFDRLAPDDPYAETIETHIDEFPIIAARRIGDVFDRLL